ncbi:discoidin domain-containing protein, partial [Candidatus Pacearchaeota archaeon]|nr:discoidin domain-containing protein [Candidatus Pacearchaeota archaeon]
RIGIRQADTGQSLTSFKFYGSNTGAFSGEETLLEDQSGGFSALVLNEERYWDFTNTTEYRYYLLDVLSVDVTYHAMQSIFLMADESVSGSDIVESFKADWASGSTATAENNSGDAPNLIDGNDATLWYGAANTTAEWVQFYKATDVTVQKIGIRPRDDGSWTQIWDEMVVKGSNTGDFSGEEDTLYDTGADTFRTFSAQNQLKEFQFPNSTGYKYIRLYVAGVNFKSMNEVTIYEEDDAPEPGAVPPIFMVI